MDHGIGKGNDNSSKEAKGTTPKGHPEKTEPRRLILKKKHATKIGLVKNGLKLNLYFL